MGSKLCFRATKTNSLAGASPRGKPRGRNRPGPRSTLRFGCKLTSHMARPRQGEVRHQRVSFRLTLKELLVLRERATRAGQSVSTTALGAAARSRPNGHPPIAMEPASFHQIRRLGVNLNQIARRLNAQDLPAPSELPPLLAAALRKARPP